MCTDHAMDNTWLVEESAVMPKTGSLLVSLRVMDCNQEVTTIPNECGGGVTYQGTLLLLGIAPSSSQIQGCKIALIYMYTGPKVKFPKLYQERTHTCTSLMERNSRNLFTSRTNTPKKTCSVTSGNCRILY